MQRINNLKPQKQKRKKLRKNMPKAEIILWSKLKNSELKNLKFRRHILSENIF
jgi:very-short-patch-repair endonuclease